MKIIIAILFVFASGLTTAQRCLDFFRFEPTEMYPSYDTLLTSQDQMYFDDAFFIFNNVQKEVGTLEMWAFHSKEELVDRLGCFYDFPRVTDQMFGWVTEVYVPDHIVRDIDFIQVIEYYDCGSKDVLVYTSRGLYSAGEGLYSDFAESTLKTICPIFRDTIDRDYVIAVDTMGYVELLESEIYYDTIIEQVLISDSYDSLFVIPAVYDSIFETIISETSTCPEAILELDSISYVSKPSEQVYNIEQAILETRTEQVLEKEIQAGIDFYKREWQTGSVPLIERSVNYSYSLNDSMVRGPYFFDYLDIDSTVIPSTDTVISSYLDVCLSGYTAAGAYCYKETEKLYEWEERSYLRLAIPASSMKENLAAVENKVYYTRVANKSGIDHSCVDTTEIRYSYLELVQPAQVDKISIPAIYGTREYYRAESAPEYLIIPGDEERITIRTIVPESQELCEIESLLPVNYDSCLKSYTIKELYRLGYLEHLLPSNLDYYSAVLQFQQDRHQLLGVMNRTFYSRI